MHCVLQAYIRLSEKTLTTAVGIVVDAAASFFPLESVGNCSSCTSLLRQGFWGPSFYVYSFHGTP